jgi:hypothetical protein
MGEKEFVCYPFGESLPFKLFSRILFYKVFNSNYADSLDETKGTGTKTGKPYYTT